MSKIPQAGVYAIENTITGRVYVGSSVDLVVRFTAHRTSLSMGYPNNNILRTDLDKHGAGAFEFVVLQRTADLNELEYLERMWVNRLGALGADGYNAVEVQKYVRTFYPTPEQLAEFKQNFLLVVATHPENHTAARALEAHGVKRPTGGFRWTPTEVAQYRRQFAYEEANAEQLAAFHAGPAQALADRVRVMRQTMKWREVLAVLAEEHKADPLAQPYRGMTEFQQLLKQYPPITHRPD